MKRLAGVALRRRLFCVLASVALFGCGTEPMALDIGIVRVTGGQSFAETRAQAARAFFAAYPDDYDTVVFWDDNNFFNAQFSFLPVSNDIAGLGYDHLARGVETFDDSLEYGSERVEGLIWMGNRWQTIEAVPGPDSIFGILAEEVGHRWAAHVHYDTGGGAESAELLDDDSSHWSGFLDAGDSPMGGRRWESLDNDSYRKLVQTEVAYADIDLYLMGLLPATDVAPMQLLVDVSSEGCLDNEPCSEGWRQRPPEFVQARVETVTIDQIVAAEGPRDPAFGAAPTAFRQAWVLVVYDDDEPADYDLDRLEQLRNDWGVFFHDATQGLGEIRTAL